MLYHILIACLQGGSFSFALNRAVENAYSSGVLCIVAAGNENVCLPIYHIHPRHRQN